MELISANKNLLFDLSGENSLRDGRLQRFDVSVIDFSVVIEMDFVMRRSSKYNFVRLRFLGCKEFYFSMGQGQNFMDVAMLKFFECENGLFYISLDPYDEAMNVDDRDGDCILCSEVFAYHLA